MSSDAFDPELATHPTRMLDCDTLVDLLHVTNLPEVVAGYRAAMQDGARFPPVSVVRLFGVWFVADGHKRFTAYRGLGRRQILVEVWPLRRWLRDQAGQAQNTLRRWRAVLAGQPGSPTIGTALFSELAHLRRILASLARSRPAAAETPQLSARSTSTRLFGAALRHRRAAALTVLGFLTLSITQLGLTWVAKLWIDGPLRQGAPTTSPLLTLTVLLVSVLSVAVFVAHYGLGSLHTSAIRDLRDELQARLLRLEVRSVESRPSGDLVARLLQDADAAGRFTGEILRRGLGDLLVLLGALVMLLVIDRRLFGLIALIAPLAIAAHALLANTIRRRSLAAQERLGRLAARFHEQIQGQRTIRGYRAEKTEQTRFGLDNESYARSQLGVERWTALTLASIWLVTGMALLGIGLYAGEALQSGRLAPGDFLVFCLFGAQMVEPIRRLGELSTLVQRSLAAGQRIFDVLDSGDSERTGGRPLPQIACATLRFEDVGFSYTNGSPVLNGLSFAVDLGATVAVVAASGEGKSTIAALLVRFIEPQRGVIRLDGYDISELPLADLRHWVKVVPQEPFLFSGSILDNLTYGTSHASAAAIDEAVQRAGLASWLRSLPNGLQASLDEAGRNLSGGQKQRIALARAIVARPAVLVLDEATSALDSETEENIMAGLADWLAQRTVLVMAHRLSTVLRVPRVLVLQSGRIVEEGLPRELLQTSSHFRRIFREQLDTTAVTQRRTAPQ
jgi:subfamily B ATP-binding cassette protein MsbA